MDANLRPSIDAAFLALVAVVPSRSTCLRRSVGCILVDERNHVLATGYNGVAPGEPHCNKGIENPPVYKDPVVPMGEREKVITFSYPNACPGHDAPSGTNLDGCNAIHAEENAITQCRDPYAIHTVYCTTEPCIRCTRMLKVTGAKRIVALQEYAGSGKKLWVGDGRTITGTDRTWHVPGWVDHEAALRALAQATALITQVRDAALAKGHRISQATPPGPAAPGVKG